MSRDRQRLADYLGRVIEAIKRIGHYTQDMSEPAFFGSLLDQDAVIRNVERIGERRR